MDYKKTIKLIKLFAKAIKAREKLINDKKENIKFKEMGLDETDKNLNEMLEMFKDFINSRKKA